MFVSKIETSKSPKINLKSGPRHRNDLSAYRLALMCPSKTKKVKLSTQSAKKWVCMGKWALISGAIYVLKDEKAPDDRTRTFSPS